MTELADLAGVHAGEDVWVLGSGASLEYVDRAFFDGRVTIGTNLVGLRWRPTTYSVTKYHQVAVDLRAAQPDVPVLVSRFLHGNHEHREWSGEADCIVFDHKQNVGADFDVVRDWPEPDQLLVSWSTITTSMHLAAHLGARAIFLVGHDCGDLGGEFRYLNYGPGGDGDRGLFAAFERQSIAVKGALRERYGVHVHSLNPFINFNLEGVPFVGVTGNRINGG